MKVDIRTITEKNYFWKKYVRGKQDTNIKLDKREEI